jgi:hypothetical protein
MAAKPWYTSWKKVFIAEKYGPLVITIAASPIITAAIVDAVKILLN